MNTLPQNGAEEKLSASEMKKCSECLAEIPKRAKKCSHCGSKQKGEMGAKHIVAFVLFAILIVMFFSSGSDNESKPATNQKVSDTQASIMAQHYVEQILKSPSTADFPTFDYSAYDLGDSKFKVVSYVDSQNGFGAMIRSDWSVVLTHNGGNWADINNWTLNELIFDNELLYSVGTNTEPTE